jgi:hypothetical protein
MAVSYSLWSFGIFFPIWYVWTKKNLATLIPDPTKINNFLRRFRALHKEAGTAFLSRLRFEFPTQIYCRKSAFSLLRFFAEVRIAVVRNAKVRNVHFIPKF